MHVYHMHSIGGEKCEKAAQIPCEPCSMFTLTLNLSRLYKNIELRKKSCQKESNGQDRKQSSEHN